MEENKNVITENKETESKATTKVAKKATPKKEVILNEDITFNLERIQKNIDFCTNAGTPDALKAGGKYFKSFSKLVADTVTMELEELKKRLTQCFPYLPNTKEGKRLSQVIEETIANSSKHFQELTRDAKNKELIVEFDKTAKEYSNSSAESLCRWICWQSC